MRPVDADRAVAAAGACGEADAGVRFVRRPGRVHGARVGGDGFGRQEGVTDAGGLEPDGVLPAERPVLAESLIRNRLQQTGIRVGFDEDVVGHRAARLRKAGRQRVYVGLRGGVDGVALRGALGHRSHFEDDHDRGHHEQRRGCQHAVASGVGDLGVPGVVHPEVQPPGEQAGHDCQHQEHRRDRLARDHRLLVEPRDAVVADVEPGVDARRRPGEHEQQCGHQEREIAPVVHAHPGEGEGGHPAQRTCQSRERAELHRPLRRRERQQQQPDCGGADQPPHRAACDSWHAASPQQDRDQPEQTQQKDEHRESARQGAVDTVLDGEEVVAQELLIPGDGRPDHVLDACRLGDGGQRLIAEHEHEDQRQRRSQGRQRGEQAVGGAPSADDLGDGPSPDQKRRQRDQALRCERDAEDRHDDRDGGKPQPTRPDGLLHQHPGGDRAERDQRLGPQPVVERQPRRQEHRSCGPHRDTIGGQATAEAGNARSG